MRIKSLYIKDYNILQDFSIDFTSNLSVLIGENGSGKSSVIECIAYIFGHLHKYFVLGDKTAEFIDGYKIQYEINDFDVYIESKYISSPTNTFDPIIKINGKKLSIAQIKKRYGVFTDFLPNKVILSYSGITEHLKNLNKHFEDKFIKKIIRLNNPYSLKPLHLPTDNPFLYVKKEFVSYVVLSLFVLSTEKSNEVLKTLGIDLEGCTITIRIKKPYWAKSKEQKDDDNLWGIKTRIAVDLFRGLNEVGILVEKNYEGQEPNDLSYEFYGSNMIRDLFQSEFGLSANQVLSLLDTLLCDDLLDSINVEWNKTFSLDKLSEGEKQLLLSIGLNMVLNKENILFLLDEPDVSLHPKWQQEFISNFKAGLDDNSMAIITTHSPSLVSDLDNKNLRLMRNGTVVNKSFKYYGKTVNDILSDYFGLDTTRNKDVAKKIEEVWNQIRGDKHIDAEFDNQFNKLVSIIGADDPEIIAMKCDILRKNYEKNK